MSVDISKLRKEYTSTGLSKEQLLADPFEQFERWFKQACDAQLAQPDAMVVSTVDADGYPTSRAVLLKSFDREGFVFYTNYESNKAQHIARNPNVSLLFLWTDLERQIQIRGRAEKISKAESLKYFLTRPKGSQLGAWCSPQSSVINSRSILEQKLAEMKAKFQNKEIPLPDFWGGYRVTPNSFEFWQGRESRLNDRFLYTPADDNSWQLERLAP
jgi:pyridoxamine 5'-phosphate oxidase